MNQYVACCPWAWEAGRVLSPPRARSSASALPVPVTMNQISSDRLRVGIVNEMRSEGGFGESVTPITLREVDSKLGCPGFIY